MFLLAFPVLTILYCDMARSRESRSEMIFWLTIILITVLLTVNTAVEMQTCSDRVQHSC